MSLDPHKAVQIAYGVMDFCNPLSPDLLDRVLGRRGAGARSAGAGPRLRQTPRWPSTWPRPTA